VKLIEATRLTPTDQAPQPLNDWRDLAAFGNDLLEASILRATSLLLGWNGKATEEEVTR